MLSEVYKYLEKSESIYDFADAVVVVRLRMTRDLYQEEIERLVCLKELNDAQEEDLKTLIGDVVALNRVIDFYKVDYE